jgi:hypothetical protein
MESGAKWLRVRVTDLKTDTAKVTVKVPMSIVSWGLRMGSKMSNLGGANLGEMGVNLEELREAMNSGLTGRIVDVTDEQKGEHVEIFVE